VISSPSASFQLYPYVIEEEYTQTTSMIHRNTPPICRMSKAPICEWKNAALKIIFRECFTSLFVAVTHHFVCLTTKSVAYYLACSAKCPRPRSCLYYASSLHARLQEVLVSLNSASSRILVAKEDREDIRESSISLSSSKCLVASI
jgi:hypothetical protein